MLSKCQCIVLSSCQFAGATDMKCTLVLAGMATSLGSIAILVPMLRKKMYFLIKFDTEKAFETFEICTDFCVLIKLHESCLGYLGKDLVFVALGYVSGIRLCGL